MESLFQDLSCGAPDMTYTVKRYSFSRDVQLLKEAHGNHSTVDLEALCSGSR